jgi:hypothetical protein
MVPLDWIKLDYKTLCSSQLVYLFFWIKVTSEVQWVASIAYAIIWNTNTMNATSQTSNSKLYLKSKWLILTFHKITHLNAVKLSELWMKQQTTQIH